jgi:hypothetical protein
MSTLYFGSKILDDHEIKKIQDNARNDVNLQYLYNTATLGLDHLTALFRTNRRGADHPVYLDAFQKAKEAIRQFQKPQGVEAYVLPPATMGAS